MYTHVTPGFLHCLSATLLEVEVFGHFEFLTPGHPAAEERKHGYRAPAFPAVPTLCLSRYFFFSLSFSPFFLSGCLSFFPFFLSVH